ncbi:MAG: ArsA family ATPase [Myxococcales bacterium FL481]|nr:MAG: ArsA family ATPase [Myxococcales bacterium FL481]
MTQGDLESTAALFDRLGRRKLLIVSGKGGVGRTTVAALLGLALAREDRRVLVATTGHDDRLAWLLGGDRLPAKPTRLGPNLWVQRLVPRECVTEFGALTLRSRRLSGLVLDNPLVRRLLRAIPGLDDFAVLGKAWHEAVRGSDYDVVVFDGAASGHLRFNLGVAKAIYDTVPDGPLRREAQEIDRSLRNPDHVGAVLVGLPQSWPLTELATLAGDLSREVGLSVATLVVNGFARLPVGLEAAVARAQQALAEGAPTRPGLVPTVAFLGRVIDRHQRQREQLASWLAGPSMSSFRGAARLHVPWRVEGFAAPEDLRALLATVEVAS